MASTVTATLGLEVRGDVVSPEAAARAVGDRKLLLLLDNCEHLITPAARLGEALLRLCPRVTILATSREVLNIDGEHVYRMAPLEVPSSDAVDPPESSAPQSISAPEETSADSYSSRRTHAPWTSDIRQEHRTFVPLARSVGIWTAYRSPSNSPRPTPPPWAPNRSWRVWITASGYCGQDGGQPCRGTERCEPRSTGATSFCRYQNEGC